MNEIRKVSTSFQRELTNAFEAEDPQDKPQSRGGPRDVRTVTAEPIDAQASDQAADTTEAEPPGGAEPA
jgi:hypothetical protein